MPVEPEVRKLPLPDVLGSVNVLNAFLVSVVSCVLISFVKTESVKLDCGCESFVPSLNTRTALSTISVAPPDGGVWTTIVRSIAAPCLRVPKSHVRLRCDRPPLVTLGQPVRETIDEPSGKDAGCGL